jgi:hypothetical protein
MDAELIRTTLRRGIAILAAPLSILVLLETASLYTLQQKANVDSSVFIFPALLVGLLILSGSIIYLVMDITSSARGEDPP